MAYKKHYNKAHNGKLSRSTTYAARKEYHSQVIIDKTETKKWEYNN